MVIRYLSLLHSTTIIFFLSCKKTTLALQAHSKLSVAVFEPMQALISYLILLYTSGFSRKEVTS